MSSDLGAFVTGASISVDGGWLLLIAIAGLALQSRWELRLPVHGSFTAH